MFFSLCLSVNRYTNTNIGLWWVIRWLNGSLLYQKPARSPKTNNILTLNKNVSLLLETKFLFHQFFQMVEGFFPSWLKALDTPTKSAWECKEILLINVFLTGFYAFTQPLHHVESVTQSHFLKQGATSLNSELSFLIICHAKIKELSVLYYLPIAESRIVGFMPFCWALVWCEM